MNIAFINFPMIERDYSRKERSQFSGEIGNHLGIGYIGAVSRAAGHDVTLYDCPNEDISFSQLMDHINSSTYNLIGISLYYPTRHLLGRFLSRLNSKDAFIVIGGHYVSTVPEEILHNFQRVDCVVIGEGENAIVQLLRTISKNEKDFSNIPGICYRNGSDIIKTSKAVLIENLDQVPEPIRNLVPNQKVTPIIATRGCYEQCGFCDVRSFYEKCEGPTYRWRSPENVAHEIIELNKLGFQYFDIIDDNFLGVARVNGWIDTFCSILEQENAMIEIEINTRVDNLCYQDLVKLKKVGLVEVGLGIENANEHVLKLFNKKASVDQAKQAVQLLRKLDLRIGSGFIFFEPDTILSDILTNIHFLREINYSSFTTAMPICLFRPLVLVPGTPLYVRYKSLNMLSAKYPGYSFSNEKTQILFKLLEDSKQSFRMLSQAIISKYSQQSIDRIRLIDRLIEIEFCFIEGAIKEIEKGKTDTFISVEGLHNSLQQFENHLN